MKLLREKVTIRTPTGTLMGTLFVGHDGLPELLVDCGCPEYYRPAQFPDAWDLDAPLGQIELGPLLRAWLMIDTARGIMVEAQREDGETDDERQDRERDEEVNRRILEEKEDIDHG